MNRPTQLPPTGAAAAVLSLLILALLAAPAASQDRPRSIGHGTHVLRRVLHEQGMRPLESVNAIFADPGRTILIVLGDPSRLGDISALVPNREGKPAGLDRFIEAGGAVLVATDQETGGELAAMYGYNVTGRFVVVDSNANAAYRGSAECPIIQAADRARVPLVRRSDRVATNRPSYLNTHEFERPVIARFPPHCHLEDSGAQATGVAFAVAQDFGKGRLLMLADHSVFINEMMWQADNDNYVFSMRCVDWLAESKPDRRDRVLFIEEGTINPKFDVPLIDPPLPAMKDLVRVADDLIYGLEKEDRFNQMLIDSVGIERIWKIILFTVTFGLLVFGLYRLVAARHRPDPSVPLAAVSAAAHVPVETVVRERQLAMLRAGNFWEPARARAREFFESLHGGPVPQSIDGHAPVGMPRVAVHTGWWEGRRLLREALHLWRLAYDEHPVRVTGADFAQLPGRIAMVRLALQDGKLHLDGPGETA